MPQNDVSFMSRMATTTSEYTELKKDFHEVPDNE